MPSFSTLTLVIFYAVFAINCSAQTTEEQALRSIRALTATGKLPAESVVADIENKFAGKRTGALARLLRAHIKYESKDFTGAAAVLDSNIFREKTKLADHALWLRGKALQSAGTHAEAMTVFAKLVDEHKDSVRFREAKLGWAESAIASGRAAEVPVYLTDLAARNDSAALLLTAKAYEAQGAQGESLKSYRRVYFFAAGTGAAKEAEGKLTSLGQSLQPLDDIEHLTRAESFLVQKNYRQAAAIFSEAGPNAKAWAPPAWRLKMITAYSNAGQMEAALKSLAEIPSIAPERQEGLRLIVVGHARVRAWPQARAAADELRRAFPNSKLLARTFIDAGLAAREAKNRIEEQYFFNTAVSAFPNALEVAQAQFEFAWTQHEADNFTASSQMLTEHLARYAGKDTANRGIAGYWSARDSERAGKIAEACALYDGVIYRYGANWYGYLAQSRLAALKSRGECRSMAAPNPTVAKAVASLRIVTVAPETAREAELERAEKSDELSIVGLFDWAILELEEAKKTAGNSPKINLALARHHRWKGDNTAAFVALRPSYPDYAQMFPEEMGREEWEIFYPLTNWAEISRWASIRNLDKYQVAGLIRQESVFQPRAKSPANAYGLMQLLLPTAKATARKYGTSVPTSYEELFSPPLNIELGTAYMRDQFDKFGRIEYVAVAYNAGPGRVGPWRASLPPEIDEFVEKIPFKETKSYVQGVVRNTAQYRRLYDESGNFKPNVGTRPLRGEIDPKSREQFTAENPDILVDISFGE
ncbi:MAG: transglycosylase SLT domain-containing protein [Blastocatellia bacterium]|nr:transglycosylase SLT domain-containing protein [Blastocatellia bacterium]